MVLRGAGVEEGIAGPDERRDGAEALRGGTAGKPAGEGRAGGGEGIAPGRWPEATLAEQSSKGDREKVKIAVQLRQETLVTVVWLATRLQMGSVANVNTLLYQWQRRRK